MKKYIRYLYIFLSILLICCKKNINNPIKHFEGKPVEKIFPHTIIDLYEFGVLRPFNFIQIDDSIFVIQDLKDDNIFNHINLSSKETVRGVNKGQGPSEVLAPVAFYYRNNKILVYDAFKKKMYKIELSSENTLVLKEDYGIDTEVAILYMVNQLDSTFIATGQFGDYWLVEMNKDGKVFSAIDFPIWEETKDIPKTALSSIYTTSRMSNSPDNKRVVVATHNQGIISFINRTDFGIKEYKQLKYHPPTFTVNGRTAAFSRDNATGFVAIDSDNNYIYTIYSGRTINSHGMQIEFCEHLLVYDWDGNPI